MAERKTPQQKRRLAKLLASDVPVTKALEQAGWSHRSAAKGWERVPADVVAVLPAKARKLIERGRMPKKDLEDLAIGRLAENIIKGKDGGAQSAKILGSHREINAWEPEGQQGQVIINLSPSMAERIAKMTAEIEAGATEKAQGPRAK
jgi:hypothetical protein